MRRQDPHGLVRFLRRAGRRMPAPLLILTHDHPDPDAMASAWALAYLAQRLAGLRARLAYGGIIGRMENQMLVRLLRIPIRPLTRATLERAASVALIDTQPPFQNNPFSAAARATLIIDHHPPHAQTQADFALIDRGVGATATLLVEACEAARLAPPAPLSTALAYGISSETQQLGREAGPRDLAAYRRCFARARVRLLAKIQNPPRPTSFFYTLGTAIHQAFVLDAVIGVHLGRVPSQDVVAHMADFLLTHEAARWSIVTGRYKDQLMVSLRTRNPRAEAGRLLWRLLGCGAAAGGHRMIAGGAISLPPRATEREWRQTEQELTAAFLRSQGRRPPFRFRYPYSGISHPRMSRG